MNTLEFHLQLNRIDPVKAMNILQDAGVISDNCITAADIADADCAKAVMSLKHALAPTELF